MKAMLTTFVWLTVIATVHSKGLRGIISYTYDDSFEGAKIYGQELSLKAFDKLLTAKDFGSEPKLLSNSYSIFGLLDGKCDVKIECCKNCDKTCSVPTAKVPAFLTTPPVIEHQTKPNSRKTSETEKVTNSPVFRIGTNPPRTKPTPSLVVEVTPPVIEHQTKPNSRKTSDTKRGTSPPVTKRGTNPPHTKPSPSVVVEVTPQTEAATLATATTPRTTALTPESVPSTPKVSPPTPTASQSIVPRKPIESRKTKTHKQEKVPAENLLLPILPRETPGRVNRMINRPSNKPFKGPPYLPQPEVTTPRVDHTWKTYAHRDVTFPSHTWQPFVATGTWIPNTAAYEDVTAAPKYVAPSNQLEGHI